MHFRVIRQSGEVLYGSKSVGVVGQQSRLVGQVTSCAVILTGYSVYLHFPERSLLRQVSNDPPPKKSNRSAEVLKVTC